MSPANLLACNLKHRHRSTVCEERLCTGKEKNSVWKETCQDHWPNLFSPLALFCREGNLRSLRGGCKIISCWSISTHHSSLKGSPKLSVDGTPLPLLQPCLRRVPISSPNYHISSKGREGRGWKGGALSRGPLGEGCCDQVTRARRLTALFITRFKWIRSDSGFGARRRGQRQRQHNANAHEGDRQLCNRSISSEGGGRKALKIGEGLRRGRRVTGGKFSFLLSEEREWWREMCLGRGGERFSSLFALRLDPPSKGQDQ